MCKLTATGWQYKSVLANILNSNAVALKQILLGTLKFFIFFSEVFYFTMQDCPCYHSWLNCTVCQEPSIIVFLHIRVFVFLCFVVLHFTMQECPSQYFQFKCSLTHVQHSLLGTLRNVLWSEYQTKVKAKAALETWFHLLYQTLAVSSKASRPHISNVKWCYL